MTKRLLSWFIQRPALCLWACASMMTGHAQTTPADREKAVIAAREGRYDEATAALRKLAAAGDASAAHDLVVVLGWAGRHAEAIAAFEALLAGTSLPAFVSLAAAASYRAERRSAASEALARALLKSNPEDAQAVRLLAGVLTDTGRASEAVVLMKAEVQRRPNDAEHWIALGNAAAARPDPFLALRAYAQAQRLAPQDRGAAAASAGVLQGLGAPYGAAMQLAEVPLALRIAQAGRQVRWATQIDPPSPARRFEGIDRALASVESLLAEVAATPGADPALQVQLRQDRAVALRHRERWADTVAASDALRADGHALPPFVRQAEADALLAVRRPAQALAAYNDVLAADPDNRSARVGRFFAEVEVEDFTAAFATIDAMAGAERPFRRTGVNTQDRPNSDWLDATILAGNARSYADMQAEAWARLEPLADGAPALAHLRSSLAAVAAGRGWPTKRSTSPPGWHRMTAASRSGWPNLRCDGSVGPKRTKVSPRCRRPFRKTPPCSARRATWPCMACPSSNSASCCAKSPTTRPVRRAPASTFTCAYSRRRSTTSGAQSAPSSAPPPSHRKARQSASAVVPGRSTAGPTYRSPHWPGPTPAR